MTVDCICGKSDYGGNSITLTFSLAYLTLFLTIRNSLKVATLLFCFLML